MTLLPEEPTREAACHKDRRSRPVGVWRGRLITCVLCGGWLVITCRLIQLQGAQRELLHAQVDRQSTFAESLPARPGEILDRSGHVLAMTVTRNSLFAVPSRIEDPWDFAWQTTSVVGGNADELLERLRQNRNRHFLWVQRRIPDDVAEEFRELELPAGTWGFRREYLRRYPQGQLAAHLVGLRDLENEGRGGLEQSLNDVIRGSDGRRVMTRDARGVVVEVAMAESQAPVHGHSVLCTIDLWTQLQTERHLDEVMERWQPQGACAIVLEPHSGEILAMASRPTFDPNLPGEIPDSAWRNLAVSAVFEPGSTFKPFVVGWALQRDAIQRDEMIECFHGAYRMGRRVLHDHHAWASLSIEDVLVKSSNIGMARIAERIGLQQLYDCTVAFGFGRRTGIELPGEVGGLVRPRSNWDGYSIGSVPMGQEIAVTPLQLVTAHGALANGGRLLRPRLLIPRDEDCAGTSGASGATAEPRQAVESTVLERSIAEWLVQHPMRQVVERGTGQSVRVNGLTIFGKTGTAQKTDEATGEYSDTRHICSFLCGAPAEHPEVLVLVMVDEPTAEGSHYGAKVAGPAAVAILQEGLARVRHLHHRVTVHPADDLPIRFR